jgi:UDP-glucose 4-epimerase
VGKWIVTGGAGYIGRHLVRAMQAENKELIVIDSLVSGIQDSIPDGTPLYKGDISNNEFIRNIIESNEIVGVINLAGLKSVEESISNPELYSGINHLAVKSLLEICVDNGVKYFIQSSSASVYGNSSDGYVSENSRLNPISPYGESKLLAENVLKNHIEAGNIQGTNLRYFNVVGTQDFDLRDRSTSNLFPKVLTAISKKKAPIIYGDDYETPDGTCVRDYVHVEDIARAHVLAMNQISEKSLPLAINIGTGIGHSVREVMNGLLKANHSELSPVVESRREGDPALLAANVELAFQEIAFKATKSFAQMLDSSYL